MFIFNALRYRWSALLIGFAAATATATAQSSAPDALLAEAEANWPALAEQLAAVEAARAQHLEAERGLRPSVSVGGTYTLAAGGRTIALPLGDLLNPAYATLNRLTESDAFPELANAEEPLLPNNFYDARLRVTQPLLRPEVALSRRLAAAGLAAGEAGAEVVRNELRAAVRTAYYQLASARAAEQIYASAEALVAEAYRTTASLVRNGAALPLARERVVAERARIRAQRASAAAATANARAQLNYYLGRPLDAEVPEVGEVTPIAEADGPADDLPAGDLPAGPVADTARRAELEQLRAGVAVADLNADLERTFRRPRLGLQLDAGSQDFDFGLQPYVLAGLSLEVPLYDGGRHAARTQRLAAERLAADARLAGAERGIALEVQVARNAYAAARAELTAFAPAIAAAERTLADADVLYHAGETGYLELLDAQNQLTAARLRYSLATYDAAIRRVEVLRALGR